MNSTDDEALLYMLRKLADEPVTPDVSSAAHSWSQIQFRLRYKFQRRRQNYMSTVMDMVVAVWILVLVSWLGGVGHLALELGATLAAAAVAAAVLCVVTHRAIRS
jgi:hypothetical protein